MRKLISMVEFVLTDKYIATGHKNYAEFLKQPLAIWQFVPCKLVDGVWLVYESYLTFNQDNNSICEPYEGLFEINANEKCKGWEYLNEIQAYKDDQRYYDGASYNIALKEYQEAKSRCIFEITGEYLFKESNMFYIIDFLQEDVNRIIICKDSSKEIHTVEYLADHKRLKLTASAIKELGL